jgi:hypothetical protein
MRRITAMSAADEAKVVDIVCSDLDKVREMITSEASWQRLQDFFYEAMLGRNTLAAATVIAWADAGHPAADRAVRRYAAEMVDQGRESELLVQVRAYIVKTMLQPFLPFPRGRHVVQNHMRDIWIPLVVRRVAKSTGLPATRSASTKEPSAAFLLAAGLKKRGFKVKEREVNRIYWNRSKLAERLAMSMPQIPSTIK